MGTGKTRTVLQFIHERQPKLVLVVGTKKGIVVWKDELYKSNLSAMIINEYGEGSIKSRAFEILKSSKDYSAFPVVICINYEAFSRKFMVEMLMKIPFEVIIFDEVHKLRNHTTNQSKYAYALARKLPNAYRIGLTGTLLYNRPLDAFGIFRFIDPSVFGTSWNAFKYHYANWTGQFGQIAYEYVNQDELRNKIEKNSFYVDRHEVLDLPYAQHIQRTTQFTPKEQKFYNTLNKEFIALLDDQKVVVKNVLDKVNKLQQLTGGFFYQDGVVQYFSDAKKQLLADVLEETDGQNVVIFYKYKGEFLVINSLINKDRPMFNINGDVNDYEAWNHYESSSILAVQIQSGAESLNFSKAGITIFYSLLSSYGLYEQALGRTDRGDAKAIYNREHVLYYYLLVDKTIDVKIMDALLHKKDLIDELLRPQR